MGRSSGDHVRFYVAVAIGVAAACVAIVMTRGEPSRAKTASSPEGEIVPWCAPGLEPIPGGGCWAAPARAPQGTPLVVYLHGRYAPSSEAEEHARQATVARLATARGYAVLALHGMQGECTQREVASFWCWPSNERNAGDGAAFVARWAPALAEAERRIGRGPRWLLGFSNGGYFAALIASRNLAPFDAVTIAHAGPVSPMQPRGPKVPMLLVTADDDPSDEEMTRLSSELARERWPHEIVSREGGHALPEWDVQMGLTFFARARTERLPLEPPLQTRVRPPKPIDDGGAAAASRHAAPEEPPRGGDAAEPAAEPAEPSGAAPAEP
jgi:predicted esterase